MSLELLVQRLWLGEVVVRVRGRYDGIPARKLVGEWARFAYDMAALACFLVCVGWIAATCRYPRGFDFYGSGESAPTVPPTPESLRREWGG